MILTVSREGPHASAIEGIQSALAAHSIASTTFQLPADDPAFRQELNNGGSQLAVAVGIDAVRAFAAGKSRVPLFATMAFRADLASVLAADGAEIKLASAVWLDLLVPQIVAGIRVVFPDVATVAVVRNSSQPESAEAASQSHQAFSGVAVEQVECGSAADLLASMRKLRGKAEFVICLPDSKLYNKTTVEPLILASLEHKLPLVGYSSSFVRAGAAMGVYPDFSDLGRQTAALAERCLSNPSGTRSEHPRHTVISVNERVLHLLGSKYRPKQGDGVVVIK